MVFLEQLLPRRRYAVLTALALIGCASPTGVGDALHVRVLGTVFERTSGFAAIPFEVVNTGHRSVYLAHCRTRIMTAVDRREGWRWVQYSGDACLAVELSSPDPLAPGARREGVRTIGAAGRYRLRLGVSSTPGGKIAWTAASRSFEVR